MDACKIILDQSGGANYFTRFHNLTMVNLYIYIEGKVKGKNEKFTLIVSGKWTINVIDKIIE